MFDDAFSGWTLRTALERTADPSLRDAFLAAEAEVFEARRDATHNSQLFVGKSPRLQRAEQKALAAFEPIMVPFRDLLASNLVASTGSRGDASVQPTSLYHEGWRSLKILNYEASRAQERTGSKVKIHNVRVFPLAHAPDLASRFAGCSLVDVLRKCVFQDPELVAATKRARREHRHLYDALLAQGRLPGGLGEHFCWPLDWTADRLASRFFASPIVSLSDEPSPSDVAVAGIIVDRLRAIQRRFTIGELRARARFAMSGIVQYLDPLEWALPDLWINARSGEVLSESENKLVLRWMGPVVLLQSAQTPLSPMNLELRSIGGPANEEFPVKPPVCDGSRSVAADCVPAVSGKSMMGAQQRERSREQCASWLHDIMMASPTERKKSKSELLRLASDRWPGISKSTFDAAWRDAIKSSKALAWSAAGAPRKRPQGEARR